MAQGRGGWGSLEPHGFLGLSILQKHPFVRGCKAAPGSTRKDTGLTGLSAETRAARRRPAGKASTRNRVTGPPCQGAGRRVAGAALPRSRDAGRGLHGGLDAELPAAHT